MSSEKWLTVAEAARQIGKPERTLRRLLARPEYADKTRQETRQTKTGTRRATLIPADLMPGIEQHFEKWENAAEGGDQKSASNTAQTRRASANTAENTALTVLQQRHIDALERHIADLQQQVSEANERERGLIQALHAEQTLRALPAGPQSSENAPAHREEPPAPLESSKRAWWQVWKREKS